MSRRVAEALHAIWRDRRRGALIALGAALVAGLLAGWLTPRGP